MNPLISSIENLIASDPGGRNIFGLMIKDQLRLAAQSLFLARHVAIVSSFYILEADASETDGPVESAFAENLLSAVLAARLYGIPTEQIAEALGRLRPNTDTL